MGVLMGSLRVLCVLIVVPVWVDDALADVEKDAVRVTLGDLALTITRDASCCGRCNDTTSYDGTNTNPTCYCDEYCLLYRDCCLDFELYCTDVERKLVQQGDSGLLETVRNCSNGLVTPPTTTIKETTLDDSELDLTLCSVWDAFEHSRSFIAEYVCKLEALWDPIILARKSNRSLVHVEAEQDSQYILVQSCGDGGSTEEMVGLCLGTTSGKLETLKDAKYVVPVTAPDGLHYRNVYCAQCNGFCEGDVLFWQVELRCPDDIIPTGLTDSSIRSCWVGSVSAPPSFMWRASQPRIVPDDEDACVSEIVFEAACEAYRLKTECAKNPHCDNRCNCKSNLDPISDIRYLPISALFDFTSHQELRFSLDGQPPALVCDGQDTFFDVALGACRRFHCPSDQSLGPHGICIVADTDLCFLSDTKEPPVITIQVEFLSRVENLDLVQSGILNLIDAFLNLTLKSNHLTACRSSNVLMSRCKLTVVTESPRSYAEISSHFVTAVKALNTSMTSVPTFIPEKVTLKNFELHSSLADKCGRLGQIPVSYSLGKDFTKLEINDTLFVNIRVDNGSVITCPSESIFHEVVFKPSEIEGLMEEFVYLCKLKLNCSLVVLNTSDFTWFDNTTLLFSSGGNLSSDEVIRLSDKEVVVCSHHGCVNCNKPIPEDAVLSVVCLVVSQLFLLLSLLSFCVFPELCTLPGKNLICFIAALFLMQTVFLIGPGSPLSQFTVADEDACLAFAVLIHYLILAAFFWTNVVSLHLARTFGLRLRMRDKRFGHAFWWYSLYGWGAPALISATGCVIHHLLVVGGVKVVIYRHCIPSDVGILFLVAAPISVLMCSNAVFFVMTVVGIRRTRKSTSMAIKKERKLDRLQSEVILCIKIFVATGMTWLVIFILGQFKVTYLINVLISLQGPILFFSFAFTKRIRSMWRARIRRGLTRDRTPADALSKGTTVTSVSRAVNIGRASHKTPQVDGAAILIEDKITECLYDQEHNGDNIFENKM